MNKNSKVDVKFTPERLSVHLKGVKEALLEGETFDRIKVEDSMWSLEDNEKLILTLEKASENIWKTVLKGDPEIDATKVDNSKPIDEFDDETQVRTLLFSESY